VTAARRQLQVRTQKDALGFSDALLVRLRIKLVAAYMLRMRIHLVCDEGWRPSSAKKRRRGCSAPSEASLQSVLLQLHRRARRRRAVGTNQPVAGQRPAAEVIDRIVSIVVAEVVRIDI
jgi:hypothetical protein